MLLFVYLIVLFMLIGMWTVAEATEKEIKAFISRRKEKRLKRLYKEAREKTMSEFYRREKTRQIIRNAWEWGDELNDLLSK